MGRKHRSKRTPQRSKRMTRDEVVAFVAGERVTPTRLTWRGMEGVR